MTTVIYPSFKNQNHGPTRKESSRVNLTNMLNHLDGIRISLFNFTNIHQHSNQCWFSMIIIDMDLQTLLVAGFEHFLNSIYIGFLIIPTDFHIFRGIKTTNQLLFMIISDAYPLVN